MSGTRGEKSGFTLVELMVAVAITGIGAVCAAGGDARAFGAVLANPARVFGPSTRNRLDFEVTVGEARPEWLDLWREWTTLTATTRGNLFFIPPDNSSGAACSQPAIPASSSR